MSQLDTVIERDIAPSAGTVDMKLEVVSSSLFRTPIARSASTATWVGGSTSIFVRGDAFRAVQFTPPGSSCSIQFCRERPLSAQAKREQPLRE